jgi:hypothetical protein
LGIFAQSLVHVGPHQFHQRLAAVFFLVTLSRSGRDRQVLGRTIEFFTRCCPLCPRGEYPSSLASNLDSFIQEISWQQLENGTQLRERAVLIPECLFGFCPAGVQLQ